MKRILAVLLMSGMAAAHAAGLDALESFLKTAKSGRADFTQVVTGPSKDGQPARARTSTGTFEFARPNRFRFEYRKPFEQTIVADGTTVWLYDADLSQVTARKQAQVLGSTPAALIASAPDLGALKKDFELTDAGEKEGQHWVQAVPRTKDGQLNSMRVGFKGEDLATLEILDGFGQKSVITFTRMELNASVPASQFQFKTPQGATVVRQ